MAQTEVTFLMHKCPHCQKRRRVDVIQWTNEGAYLVKARTCLHVWEARY